MNTVTTLSVAIDVCDEDNIVEEAQAVGCQATKVRESPWSIGNYEYVVTGPEDQILPLLKRWGYDDDCYEIIRRSQCLTEESK